MASAEANGWERASPLVLTLSPLSAIKTPVYSLSSPAETASGKAYLLTSHWQISRDLVEEWIALGRKPLCSYTRMGETMELDGYKCPVLECERPNNFWNDRSFILFVENEAEKICGCYQLKEQKAKVDSLGSRCRLN